MMRSSSTGTAGFRRTALRERYVRMASKMSPEVSPRNGTASGGHFVEDGAEGEKIGARVEFFARGLARETCRRGAEQWRRGW